MHQTPSSSPLGKAAAGAYDFTMDLSKLRKVESPSPRRAAGEVRGMVTGMVKVNKAGYRPKGVKVRGEISDLIFTAEIPVGELEALENDPGVASVAFSRPLQSQQSKRK
ncbi:MAG: hypothetical protein IPK22_10975 [Verrucomicrobiaceae bacterium]|nr:hypothetical protein [Verrucomicrobiaceae bacterium]MBK8037644.1 hypothetical protein [Verrucomicrobiaceae bacterium]